MAFPIAKALREPDKAVVYLYFYLHSYALVLLRGRRFIRFRGQLPQRAHSIWKVCRLLGLTPSLTRGQPVFQHIDATWCDPSPVPAINGRSCDLSKSTVARTFGEVFGYPLLIEDPLTHVGPIAAKSERNAPHDGGILQGPLEDLREGVCYQRLIDSSIGHGEIADLRTKIVGDEIVQVVLKTRPDRPERLFYTGGPGRRAVPMEPEEAFSAEERRCILEFCRRMQLDFGELDILRDRADGRIYIVDAANTPHTPAAKLTMWQRIAVMKRIAASFERQFCKQAAEATRDDPAGGTRRGGFIG